MYSSRSARRACLAWPAGAIYNADMSDPINSTPVAVQTNPGFIDLGHQGDVDRTHIAARLRMSPTRLSPPRRFFRAQGTH